MERLFQFERFEFILFYIITILWISEFFIFPSHFKGKDKNETKSFLKILAVILVSHTVTILFTIFDLFIITNQFGSVLPYIAIVIYIIGLSLRYISIMYLGKYFTRDVEVSKDQELVSQGPYLVLRHPLYLGLFLLTISVPLFFANLFMIIISITIMFLILNLRMNIEEKLMEETIGHPYIVWKKKRYRFIPFIY